jgi:hypothetical protein
MLCERCKVKQTHSEYELDGKRIPLCFFCLRTYLEEGKKPIGVKEDREEDEKRKELELKEKTDFFRKIPEQSKYWIEKYLSLSGIQRNKYSQIVDKYKRLSISQISGIIQEVHGYHVSPEMIGKYKQFLIKEGLLRTDKEFEEERPSEEELRQIRKEGARATSIKRSKEKTHLDPKELQDILERRKEGKEELAQDRIKELRKKEERGLCLTCEEEEELEEYEENQEEDI